MARIAVALSLLLLAAAASAGRTVEIVEHSLEAALADLTLPSGASGNVIVARECEGCEPRTVLATTDTLYLVEDARVPHAEFARHVELIRSASAADETLVGIYFDPASSRATRIKLFRSGE